MKIVARPSRRGRLLTAVAVASTALSLVAIAPAAAAPFTFASGGRSVTFSTGKVTAALPATQRVAVTGTGWTGANPSSDSHPVVAFKLDNLDTFAGWGGDDRHVIAASPTTVAFEADNTTGDFSGWIDLPADLVKTGPGTGPNAGRHWFRVLAGAFSTPGTPANPVSPGLSGQAFFDAAEAPATGYQQGPAATFFPGTFIPATGTSLKVSGNLDTAAVTPVSVSLDGIAITTAKTFGTQDALTTSAAGDFTAAVPVPAGSAGVKILSFTAGGTTQSVAITVTPRAATRQSTPTPSPGDTVTVAGTGFRSIGGSGQKVGLILMPGDTFLGCADADAQGNVSVSGTLPADTTLGARSLWLAAGAACVPMGAVVEPIPGLVQLTGANGITVVEKPAATPTPTPAPTATPGPTPVPTPTPLASPNAPQPAAPQATKVVSASKGSALQITFGADAAGVSVKIGATTKSKVKLTSKGRAKIVTVVKPRTLKASTGKAPKVVVTLTADGKRLLRARGSLKIVLTIQQRGRVTVTKTVTIKP